MKFQALFSMLIASALTHQIGCGEDGPMCGDGRLDATEQCDDGNGVAGDGCSPACTNEVELCTDGADNDGDGNIDCDDTDCVTFAACEAICSAPVVVDDPVNVQGDTTGSSDFSVSECQEMFGGAGGADQVFEVTPVNEVLQVRLQSDFDQGIAVRTVCDDALSEIGCSDFFLGGGDEIIVTRVTPNEPVTLVVGAFEAGQEGPYSLDIVSRPIVCNDGVVDRPEEQCDDMNNDPADGCDDVCQFELVCGDGYIAHEDNGGNETCDDGNAVAGDGCDDVCQAEATLEVEPNEDGTPEPGGMETNGNDFDPAGAQGPYTEDIIIEAVLSPAGDEDIFAFENLSPYYESVRFDTHRKGRGIGQPCFGLLDTSLQLRNDTGLRLDGNDDRDDAADRCSGLDYLMAPGQILFAHVSYWGDNFESDPYYLTVKFASCGDGVMEGLEACDDGNNDPGDGCNETCESE